MRPYTEAVRNVLDKFGRRSGLERRVAETGSFPFERRNPGERRRNMLDRRHHMVGRYWASKKDQYAY